MTTKTKPPISLQDLLMDANLEYRPYSGRGMYGEECLAVTLEHGETAESLWADVLECILENWNGEDAIKRVAVMTAAMRNTRSDSMGMGSIIYWPGNPFVK
jgi:hypothetical protein